MSRYLERDLQINEKVIYESKLHWIVYHQGSFFVFLGFMLGVLSPSLVLNYLPPEVSEWGEIPVEYMSLGVIGFGGLLMIAAFLRQISTELIITNRRVIAKYGLIATTTFELMIPKVEGANIDQTIMGRILGFGTVMVKGTGGGISPIDHVDNPYRFHTHLMETVRKAHEESNGRGMHD